MFGGSDSRATDTSPLSCTLFDQNDHQASASCSTSTATTSKSTMGTLTMDKAAFLLIRIRRVFRKKKNKSNVALKTGGSSTSTRKQKPPLLRARTLPAIVSPSISIVQAQLESGANTPSAERSNTTASDKLLKDQNFLGKLGAKAAAARRSSNNRSKHGHGEPQLKFCLLVEDEDEDETAGSSSSRARSSTTPLVSPRHSVSSTSSTGSTVGAPAKDSKKPAGFAKLARLLSAQPKDRTSNADKTPLSLMPTSDSSMDISCFSWNKTTAADIASVGVSPIKKSGSVDSLLDSSSSAAGLSIAPSVSSQGRGPQISICLTEPIESRVERNGGYLRPPKNCYPLPLVGTTTEAAFVQKSRSGGFVPSSPSLHNRLAKSITGRRQSSMDFLHPDGMSLAKAEKKRLERLNKFNFHLQALFSAVEHEQVERAKTLLETTDVDVNSVNTDGFSTLDIAVMTLNTPLVRLLQMHGAKESNCFPTTESRAKQLNSLTRNAEHNTQELNASILSASTNGNLSAAMLKEKEKQLAFWRRRLTLLQRMQKGFEHINCPDPPPTAILDVVGTRSLKVRFSEPLTASQPDRIVTKFRVEWSGDENFEDLAGFRELTDLKKLEVIIYGLSPGKSYFSRVSAGNAKGFGAFCTSAAATPSSWRDLDESLPRSVGKLAKLEELFQGIIDSRPKHAAEVKVWSSESETSGHQRKGQMRKSIKHLFAPTPKFQKTMKRGVYLGCLFFHENRILVTNDDNLPIVEVDDALSTSSWHNDFHWLYKVSCTWEDVRTFRLELEKSQSSSSAHFRSRLLQGVEQLQTALGTQELGQLYYEPLRDSEGTTIICCVKQVDEPKSISSLSVRWLPMTKFRRKTGGSGFSPENSDSSIGMTAIRDLLHTSLQDMIDYNRVSRAPLARGLYLGYVKLKSSVDLIRVVTARTAPNVLPHSRVRENPHVSREEWQWLGKCDKDGLAFVDAPDSTDGQLKFARSLIAAARHLEKSLRLQGLESHRLYNAEVIELSQDVSFILLLPPLERVCSVPGQSDPIADREDMIQLPVQIFEMIHMNTYQRAFITKYSRISSILEMDTMVALQAQREAFSTNEISTTKSRISQLQEFQGTVDNVWKTMRWIMDVINFARDKQTSGIGFGALLARLSLRTDDDLLDEPDSPRLVVPSICLPTPLQLQVPNASGYHSQRRTSRDDSTIGLSSASGLQSKISASTSTMYLFEPLVTPRPSLLGEPTEIRRCASTSRLAQPAEFEHRGCETLGAHLHASSSNNCDTLHCQIKSRSFDQNEFKELSTERSFTTNAELTQSLVERMLVKNDGSSVTSLNSGGSGDSKGSTSDSWLDVYGAYETGVETGTCIKVQASELTDAKEITRLVMEQFNTIIRVKGLQGPFCTAFDKYELFYVDDVHQEHPLESDFKVLNLDRQCLLSSKFYVRKKCVN